MGQYLSIDEVNLSMGELYTVVTNKEAKGKKGAIVAIVAGTKSETVINHLQRNASAESFNTKTKAFRSQFRGVRNVEFFLFRLTNIYA